MSYTDNTEKKAVAHAPSYGIELIPAQVPANTRQFKL